MWHSLCRGLNRVRRDLLNFRNIEAYGAMLVGIALIVIDIIGDVSDADKLTVIIAALVILLFRSTAPAMPKRGLDDVLANRDKFGPFKEFLSGGRTLWVCAPSAANILRDPSPIKEKILSNKQAEIVMLLQDPDEQIVIQNLQNQLDIAARQLTEDIELATTMLERLRLYRAPQHSIEYGYLPYSPGFSLIIVDPERSTGRLVVEFFGFHNEFIGSRMHIEISRQESEYWFEYWVDQFREMQQTARMAQPVIPKGAINPS
jgi:hypothetical protein